MQKILLDSNILIYAMDIGSDFYKKSKKIISSDLELFCTQSSLLEFYRVITSKAYENRSSFVEVQETMDFYKQRLNILYPTQITDYILADLIKQHQPKSGQIWDFLVLAQCLENKMSILYTKNVKHFPPYDYLKIIDPTV